MSFLLNEDVQSVRITNMILHVVGEDEFELSPAQPVEHEQFFIDRIRDTDVAAIHVFEPASNTKAQLERISTGTVGFEEAAQALSRDFSRLHVGTSREGAFFIFEIATDDPSVRIYSLIKYDYREAIEQTQRREGSLLRRIVHAFIADKKAIQKSALVRVVDGTAEMSVAARDRMKLAPDIGDYFATFLDVSRNRSDQELNRDVVELLRKTLTSCQDSLPERDVARAFRHAKDVLRDRQEINEEAITEAILAAADNPDDEAIRAELQAKTMLHIRRAKLHGLSFSPDRRILRRPPMRQVKTTEGVTLTYPDEADGATVNRESRPDGGEVITIQTERVTEDHLVRAKSRGVD